MLLKAGFVLIIGLLNYNLIWPCPAVAAASGSITRKLLPPQPQTLNVSNTTPYEDCESLMHAGYNISGDYQLTVEEKKFLVFCEFQGGKATLVILKRVDGRLSFIRPWRDYEVGFGQVTGNYWAGLSTIYSLTHQGHRNLRVTITDWNGNVRYRDYSGFYLDERKERYRLHLGSSTGTAPDDLFFQNGMPFSTFDAPDPNGCALGMNAGWWYNYCAYSLLTGTYYIGGPYTPQGSMYDGIYWKDWLGYGYSLKAVTMTLSKN